jgi:hypothetical protein
MISAYDFYITFISLISWISKIGMTTKLRFAFLTPPSTSNDELERMCSKSFLGASRATALTAFSAN